MFSKFFINRPIFATVISLVIILAGLVSIKALPVEQYPSIVPTEIQVTAIYPGATAEVLADTVAAPLEQEINGVKNMIYMYSNATSSGYLTIGVVFDIGTDPDQATIDVNNKVQMATAKLPAEVTKQGVTVEQKSTSILQLITMRSMSEQYDTVYVANYALLNVLDEIRRIKGVGSADLFSSQDYSMRIWLSPDKLADYNMTPQDIISAIQEQNAQYAVGQFGQQPLDKELPYTYSVNTKGRLVNEKEFGDIILKSDNQGGLLRLKDVARIELGSQDYSVSSTFNGEPAVAFAIYLQPGANALETAEMIRNKMQELSKNFPDGIVYEIPYDTTVFVNVSIKEVVHTFFEAVVLVILVVYLFLQKMRATLIPILAVPVSIIGAFAGMYLLGFSINLLTLFGLILAIGIVVDDAIIVLENVERLMETEHLSPKEAAIKAMQEVSGPVVAVALVLSAVFLPIAFLGGMTGVMYKQFSVTIAVSVLISALVALSLTPALCALIIPPHQKDKKQLAFFRWFNSFFDKLTDWYVAGVKFFLNYRKIAVISFVGVIACILWLFKVVPGGLVPSEDLGTLLVSYAMPEATSLPYTEKLTSNIGSQISEDKNVSDILTINGYNMLSSSQNTYSAISFITLTDWDERKEDSQASSTLSKKFTAIGMSQPEGIGVAFEMPAITGLSMTGGFEGYIQNKSGKTSAELMAKTQEFIAAANKRPELSGVQTTFSVSTPQYRIDLDREKARVLNVSIDSIYAVLQSTFGSLYVNDFTYMGRNFRVTLQSEARFRSTPDDLRYVYVKSKDGNLVPISTLIHVERVTGPELVNRFNIFPAAKILGNPAMGYSSGQAIRAMEEVASEVLGQDFALSWIGSAYQEKQAGSSSSQAFIFGLIMIFLILAAQYERWSLPFVVILSVPFAVLGALMAVWIRGIENDLYFQVGLVTLIGLAAKNAILIVEFAMMKVEEGLSYAKAAIEAAKLRFRPIVMTSLAFTFGVLPLAISTGAGANSRHAIGTGMIGGMILSTFVATLFVPMFFAFVGEIFDRKNNKKEG
ncbi:MAG: multidrug efflux RND transporter permease subunit [Alphaproteobacteria bacterium]|nr:multidrug efflux RND transporter permease subunit [Alphaproteobacteria bacterium]